MEFVDVISDDVVVKNGEHHISQSALRRFLDIKKLMDKISAAEDKLKNELIAALLEGRKAEEGLGKLSANLSERDPRVSWKDVAEELAKHLGYDWSNVEERAKKEAASSGKKTYVLKVG